MVEVSLFHIFFGALVHHSISLSFVTGLFMEEAVLLLSFLSTHSSIPLAIIILVSPLGLVVTDSLFFLLGKSGLYQYIGGKSGFLRRHGRLPPLMKKFHNGYPFLMLLMSKFVVGTRLATTTVFSLEGMKYRTYLVYDLLALYVWALIMVPLGWLAGKGFTGGLHIFRDFSTIAGIALLFFVAWYLLNRVIRDEVLAKRK